MNKSVIDKQADKLLRALDVLREGKHDFSKAFKIQKVAKMYNLDRKMLGRAYSIPRSEEYAVVDKKSATRFVDWWHSLRDKASFEEFYTYLSLEKI